MLVIATQAGTIPALRSPYALIAESQQMTRSDLPSKLAPELGMNYKRLSFDWRLRGCSSSCPHCRSILNTISTTNNAPRTRLKVSSAVPAALIPLAQRVLPVHDLGPGINVVMLAASQHPPCRRQHLLPGRNLTVSGLVYSAVDGEGIGALGLDCT